MNPQTITLPNGALVLKPPHGLTELRATFGPISVADGQIVSPPHWESVNMKMVSDLPGWNKRLYLNRAIEAPLRLALRRCVDLLDGYVIHSLGCFAPRAKRANPDALSLHSWGIAVDICADNNPLCPSPRPTPAVGERDENGRLLRDLPDAWVEIFESIGWTWGGRWARPDCMHMQWASGV